MNSMKIEKVNLFGIYFSVVDYAMALKVIIKHAKKRNSFGVSAIAVHGLIEGVRNKEIGDAIRKVDLIVPDGQPVKWAMNSFYKTNLIDRVYGPTLTLKVLEKANVENLRIYLFGSTENTLSKLMKFINKNYPKVELCGIHSDRFREATAQEDFEDIKKINQSKAHIVLVGRGCPRQEKWVADHLGKVSAVMIAVGAAFDFHAGNISQAPRFMQDLGLEWLYRLFLEPKRLWRRYLLTNTYFIFLCIRHKLALNSKMLRQINNGS